MSTTSEEANNSEEEVGTLFFSGLPTDIEPSELYLVFRSFKGYEGSVIKLASQQLVGCVTFNSRAGADATMKNAAFTQPVAAALHSQMCWYPPSEVSLQGWEDNKKDIIFGDIAAGSSKNAKKCLFGPRSCLWPRSRDGIVYIPYTIDQRYSKYHQGIIQNSMKEFDYLTCIKFVYRRFERNYIKIISKNGCWANVGYNKRKQFVSLDRNGCIRPGIIQHELLHTIGFNHEQNRSDRDDYVTIVYKNIVKGAEYNFVKMDTNNLGTKYDYSSVMHYGRYAFSKDRKSVTIIPKPNSRIYIGQRYGMSHLDALKVNKLYNCNAARPAELKADVQ
ncbi:low choriolytic enzyme-like [Hemiscyllium ocellatum]|uniref:low choriolytic enzyme-like n=1 Tax=Hemiscyllium ocellatum TaxID=170820 RepID=UPI00296617BA|nr:low choriolytic enzyme-like [Hemiscyllium ocellatum]